MIDTKNLDLDEYKLAVMEEFEKGSSDMAITAPPGSGKSFLAEVLCRNIPRNKKVLVTSFGKEITKELEEKMLDLGHVKVQNIHSIAFKVIASSVGRIKTPDSEGKKYFDLAIKNIDVSIITLTDKELEAVRKKGASIEQATKRKRFAYISRVAKLLELAQLFDCKTVNDLKEVDRDREISYFGTEVGHAFKLLEIVGKSGLHDPHNGMFTFTDLIWYSVKFVEKELIPKYDYIIIDEFQDLNNISYAFLEKMRKRGTRIIAFGDDKQAIFGFQGSSVEVMRSFMDKPTTKCLELFYTRRCSKAVVEFANKIFPNKLIAHESNSDGEVIKDGDYLEAQSGDLILCRNNAPLIDVFIDYMINKIPCSLVGRDMQERILDMLSFNKSMQEIETYLSDFKDFLKSKGVEKPENKPDYVALEETASIIHKLNNHFGGSFENLIWRVKQMFGDPKDKNKVRIMTIHSSKGLQGKNVYIVNKSLMPSKFAKTDSERYGEKCLEYVAITRTINNLIFTQVEDE